MKYLIRLYQSYVSPLFKPQCRYQPTCSQYAIESLDRFGFMKGTYLMLLRILRCNPLFKPGYDPVPEKFQIFFKSVYFQIGKCPPSFFLNQEMFR